MSNIAGLLSSLLSLPQPDAPASRGSSGQPGNADAGKGGANGFDAILSKLSQNGAAGNAGLPVQLFGAAGKNPDGSASAGANPSASGAGETSANTIIEKAIASMETQAQAEDASRAAASTLMSKAASAAKAGTSLPTSDTTATARLAASATSSTTLPNALLSANGTLPGTGTLAALGAQLPGSAKGAQQSASADALSPTASAPLPAALTLALTADASASADSQTATQKSNPANAANPANTAATNNAAQNAAAVVTTLIASGQPLMTSTPPTPTDKASANGKTGRSSGADSAGSTASKQNTAAAKTDSTNAALTPDPALQSAVLANVGLDGSVPQPSLLVQSNTGQGSSDPNLKAITTASAVATANAAAKLGASADDGDDVGPTVVSVLSTETHFAPPAQLSPIQQIADSVIGALPNPSQPFASAAADDSADTDSTVAGTASASAVPDAGGVASSGPVKVLNLQLEPPSLGTVTINLSLSDGGLNVQLAASQASTMSIIDKDKDALSNQLRESGYSVADVGVTLGLDGSNVANNGSATQDQMGQSAAQGGQTMSNGGSSNGSGSSQSGSNGSPQQQYSEQAADLPPSVASRGSSAGDLYI